MEEFKMNLVYDNNLKTVSGHIRPRPNANNVKYYELILELGKDPISKKRKTLSYRADTVDPKKAENMLMIKKAEYLSGNMVKPSKQTVSDFLDEYLQDYVIVNNSPATVRDYKEAIEKYLKPEFGYMKLQELTRTNVQRVYNRWREKSPLSDKPLKATTIQHINRVFKAALNVACELEYIEKNPARRIKIGKDDVTRHIDVYTIDEIKKLQKSIKNTSMELPVALLLDGILRRGELLGLRYSDIDFETNTITVQYSWTETDGKNPVLKDCKTSCSYRKIVVSEYTMKLLKRQRLKYMQNRIKYGDDFCDSNRIVCKENGEPYLPKSFTHKWSATLKKCGLRHIRLHDVRHTAISLLISEGVPIHMVQNRAGHKDPKITLGIYAHVAKDKETLVANKLDTLLFSENTL